MLSLPRVSSTVSISAELSKPGILIYKTDQPKIKKLTYLQNLPNHFGIVKGEGRRQDLPRGGRYPTTAESVGVPAIFSPLDRSTLLFSRYR